jgi:RHS repeat-associated protein
LFRIRVFQRCSNLEGIIPTLLHNADGQSFTLNYEAENRLVSVTGASTANFYYDGDGKQVKTVVNGVTTYYIGNHYEVKNSVVTKYYFAGATRLAVRTGTTLSYLLSDHIGSSSVTTDANGVKTASALYKAFGETRFSSGNLGTDYKFTGQREEASLGIYYFNARWMDPSLGRFTSPDSIVPTSTQGTQAWDRYGFVNNNPVRYNDPTGHGVDCGIGQSCAFDQGYENGNSVTWSGITCDDRNAENFGAKSDCRYPPPKPQSGNGSQCTSDGNNATCTIFISQDEADLLYNLLITLVVMEGVLGVFAGLSGFFGNGVGVIAALLLGGAAIYDAITGVADLMPEINNAAATGTPLSITTAGTPWGFTTSNNDYLFTPAQMLVIDLAIYMSTGGNNILNPFHP